MKKQFIAAAVLAMSAMTGVAQADLATDLTQMPAADALAKAFQTQGASIEALIADAAGQLEKSPQLLNALISAAVNAYPEQAAQIVYSAVSAAPSQKASITRTATAQLADNPAAQAAVQEAADTAEQQVVQGGDTGSGTETVAEQGEFEAENTEAEAPAPEASTPPPASGGSTDKPPAVSPN